ncbi:Gmad2 immunoglobulin-like domain-containing protein [Cellulomonas sp. NS3]|uniref:Gmad2 immunoglobulin-like domain-containing protein n=1 Tax=Cellulomonas sp. NS3 TaxID=2973977 RepID=UPI0021629E14|nr:Gmad2 immunoglobulin-like domain-containing protein [Cellulomonas sp. NS3]
MLAARTCGEITGPWRVLRPVPSDPGQTRDVRRAAHQDDEGDAMRARAGRQGRAAARTVLVRATAVALGAGLLAGCAGTSGEEPTTSPSPEPSATSPSASATPEPTASPSGSPVAGDTPTNGPVAITAPTSGATVAGPQVDVTGTGTAFEGTLLWEAVSVDTGEVGAQDFTNAGANGEVGPFAFTATLPAGTWTLHVWEPGMGEGDGAAARRNEATVTFTVS